MKKKVFQTYLKKAKTLISLIFVERTLLTIKGCCTSYLEIVSAILFYQRNNCYSSFKSLYKVHLRLSSLCPQHLFPKQ